MPRSNLVTQAFAWAKVKIMHYLETMAAIDLKVGLNIQINEFMKSSEYQRSRTLFDLGQWSLRFQAGPRSAIGRAPDLFDTRSGVSPSAFSRRAVVSYWRKYVHEVLVNRLGGLSLPRKSVVRLTDRPNMTVDVYHGRKTTIQQYNLDFKIKSCFSQKLLSHLEPNFI